MILGVSDSKHLISPLTSSIEKLNEAGQAENILLNNPSMSRLPDRSMTMTADEDTAGGGPTLSSKSKAPQGQRRRLKIATFGKVNSFRKDLVDYNAEIEHNLRNSDLTGSFLPGIYNK